MTLLTQLATNTPSFKCYPAPRTLVIVDQVIWIYGSYSHDLKIMACTVDLN